MTQGRGVRHLLTQSVHISSLSTGTRRSVLEQPHVAYVYQ